MSLTKEANENVFEESGRNQTLQDTGGLQHIKNNRESIVKQQEAPLGHVVRGEAMECNWKFILNWKSWLLKCSD